jgi:di/tricarboxylate transporter
MIAGFLAKNIGSPVTLFILIYLICLLITAFMSNGASAGVVLPIAISSALAIGASPLPYCMAVGIAVSLDFLMPFGSGSCIIAYEMGGYSYMDFVRKGTPLMLLCTLVGLITIPIFFPF